MMPISTCLRTGTDHSLQPQIRSNTMTLAIIMCAFYIVTDFVALKWG